MPLVSLSVYSDFDYQSVCPLTCVTTHCTVSNIKLITIKINPWQARDLKYLISRMYKTSAWRMWWRDSSSTCSYHGIVCITEFWKGSGFKEGALELSRFFFFDRWWCYQKYLLFLFNFLNKWYIFWIPVSTLYKKALTDNSYTHSWSLLFSAPTVMFMIPCWSI